MSENTLASVWKAVDASYRTDSRRVLATLIRLLGDFELAERCLQSSARAAAHRAEKLIGPLSIWLLTERLEGEKSRSLRQTEGFGGS